MQSKKLPHEITLLINGEEETIIPVLKVMGYNLNGFPEISPNQHKALYLQRNGYVSYLGNSTNNEYPPEYFRPQYTQLTVRQFLQKYVFSDPLLATYDIPENHIYLGKLSKNGNPVPENLLRRNQYSGYNPLTGKKHFGEYMGSNIRLGYSIHYTNPLVPDLVAHRLEIISTVPDQVPKKQPCLEDIFSGL